MTLNESWTGPGSLAGPTYWLIPGRPGPDDVFVLDLAGFGRSLPVFSFREEAELFLTFGGLGDGWRVGEGRVGDLLALFLGACADVESVILDPLPAALGDSTIGLAGLSPGRFVDRFLGGGGPG